MDQRNAVVLVVTADRALRERLRTALSRHGFDTGVAGTLREALDRVGSRELDVIVAELQLPDGVAMELLGRDQRRGRPPELVLIAGAEERARAVAALRAGASAYVLEPFVDDEIVAQVASAAGRRPVVSAAGRRPVKPVAPGWSRIAAEAGLSLAELERAYIDAVLELEGGHRGRTARRLQIDPKTLYNKLGPRRPRRPRTAPPVADASPPPLDD
jgi:DNA-binding NtrC family response regulator